MGKVQIAMKAQVHQATGPDKVEIQTHSYLTLAGQPLQNKMGKVVINRQIHVWIWYLSVSSPTKIVRGENESSKLDVFHTMESDNLPSSSETSKISSTVSGKLIRCFSVVICEEQKQVVRRRGEKKPDGKCWLIFARLIMTRTLFHWTSESWCVKATSLRVWCNHANRVRRAAHRRDGLLGNQLQHVNDRDVTQTLRDAQGRRAILYRPNISNWFSSMFTIKT